MLVGLHGDPRQSHPCSRQSPQMLASAHLPQTAAGKQVTTTKWHSQLEPLQPVTLEYFIHITWSLSLGSFWSWHRRIHAKTQGFARLIFLYKSCYSKLLFCAFFAQIWTSPFLAIRWLIKYHGSTWLRSHAITMASLLLAWNLSTSPISRTQPETIQKQSKTSSLRYPEIKIWKRHHADWMILPYNHV